MRKIKCSVCGKWRDFNDWICLYCQKGDKHMNFITKERIKEIVLDKCEVGCTESDFKFILAVTNQALAEQKEAIAKHLDTKVKNHGDPSCKACVGFAATSQQLRDR